MTSARFKICGISDPADVPAALLAGASYLGFVFFPKSPRNLDLPSATAMAGSVPPGIMKVALVVDPSDEALDLLTGTVPLDMLQLHGAESPERVRDIKARTGLPVMKAVGVAGLEDLPRIDTYAEVADQLLIDAKPPRDAELPGGNGLAFDWRLITGRSWSKPWMLAGGLTPENVAEAVRVTGAPQVDVSSGVEARPGVKDADKIAAFGKAISGG
ncbi:phosphoribosylanthranilate isomerase [Palleronia sp.]|uniref:phosphoribosylanthranilate isomerase n=1 Tax=Palleronia sp. TaxID=1940284 RepID=UPI0035C8154C